MYDLPQWVLGAPMQNSLCCLCCRAAPQVTYSISAWVMASFIGLWCKQITVSPQLFGEVIQATVSVRKDTIYFAVMSPSASQMRNWLLNSSETNSEDFLTGVFERQSVWEEKQRKKDRKGGNSKRQPKMLSEREKPCPFEVLSLLLSTY